ncbi:NAD(P)-dependent oxidoreductase [Pedobacter sp. Hv1]|uniref:NAD(P)-dependent oxidoreductase n=1 Tax=Pedobacter sp. Hv1 TaxID=1740090 RepID=UPI0006D8C9FD|nr:NAD(P)H-binding protein [Pedobacter sp. Hv1]KQC01576.1 hypothetical protein AQF98_07685 [Pedobacter sp. Hv1]
MTQQTKVAVIGGTGKSGKYIVKNLLAQGFLIKVLLRYPEQFQLHHPLIEIVQGDARDITAIRQLLKDCQVVISAVGQPVGEPSVFSQVSRNIIEVMQEFKLQRYILLTGLNVDTPFDRKSPKTKFGTDWMKANYPLTTADKQVEYETLVQSDIDWTLVRLPMIEQTDTISEVRVDLEDCPGDQISATDLALFLIEQLTDRTYVRKAPFITST